MLGKYCGLQVKNTMGYFLRMLCAMTVLIILSAAILFSYVNLKEQRMTQQMIKVGVCLPEEDQVLRTLIPFANSISGLQGFCRLEIFSYDEGTRAIQNGEIPMLLVIPDGFYETASRMEQAEFVVYITDRAGIGEKKLLAMFEAVEQMMVTTEGGICSMYEGMKKYSFPMTIYEMQDEVMSLYVAQFLKHGDYFDTKYLSPYGDYGFIQFYTGSAFLFIISICGVFFLNVYSWGQESIERIVARTSSDRLLLVGIKLIAIFLPVFCLGAAAIAVVNQVCDTVGSSFVIASGRTYIYAFLSLLCISAFINLLAVFLSKESFKSGVYVLIIVFVFIISGAIVPLPYLPRMMQWVAQLLPPAVCHRIFLWGLWGEGSIPFGFIALCIIYILGAYVFGFEVYIKSRRGA